MQYSDFLAEDEKRSFVRKMFSATPTDETLMSALTGGDLDAAASLFQRYQTALFHFFMRLGYIPAESEDMVQTVFERMIRYRQSYRTDTNFKAWMYRIARNVRADFYQKRFVFDPVDHAKAEPGPTPQETMEQEDQIRHLQQAMHALSGDQRELLILTRYQGLRYAEVAEMYGVSEGVVKVRVFRALQQLRTIYFQLDNR